MKDISQKKKDLSYKLQKRAILEGFAVSGIASIPGSSRLRLRTKALDRWLANNYHGEMRWMESEKRNKRRAKRRKGVSGDSRMKLEI